MSHYCRAVAVLAFLAVVAACSGGGGGGGGGDGGDDGGSGSTGSFKVTVSSTSGGGISPESANVDSGDKARFTVTADTGHHVVSVSGCGGSLAADTFTTGPISTACTVTATFAADVYTIDASAGANGSVTPASADVEFGSTADFTLSPDIGYSIESVTGCDGTLNGDVYTLGPVSAACSLTVTFVINTYHVATSGDGHGEITPESADLTYGSTADFTIVPAEGYSISQVVGCDGTLNGNTYTLDPVGADCTLSASFSIDSYVVATSAGDHGAVSPTEAMVEYGDSVSFELTPDEGYLIDSVSGCGGTLAQNVYTTGPISGACTVSATFRLPRVSGVLTAAPGNAADGDVNDPYAPYTLNDFSNTPQYVATPFVLGGYLNQASAGPDGRSYAFGDDFDFYQFHFAAGDSAVLNIASSDTADDLDLWLLDPDGYVVDASLNATSRVETLAAPADGEYELLVYAFSGASEYLLTVDQTTTTSTPRLRLSDAFVPGEAIVRFKDSPAAEALEQRVQAAALSPLAPRRTEARRRNLLLRLNALKQIAAQDAGAPFAAALAADDVCGLGGAIKVRDRSTADKIATLCQLKAVQRDPSTLAAEPNYLYRPSSAVIPNDPRFGEQWHYTQINVPNAWNLSTGANVIAAVVDSGVLLQHPDLQNQFVPGYDFLLNVPGGDDPTAADAHGTHVAGTIAAATNNGTGVAGVAYGAKIMPLRVCVDTCPEYAIEQAVRFAAGLPNDSGDVPDTPADVINLSLGGGSPSTLEQQLYNDVRAAGVIVVAAAGNEGMSTPSYPAAYDGVIAVGATERRNRRASYSNYGPWVDVVAPGGDASDPYGNGIVDGVLSTWGYDDGSGIQFGYAPLMGTSMATPHMAGVIALMRSVAPDLTPDDVDAMISSGAITDDLGDPGKDDIFGYGLINAVKAVSAALTFEGQAINLDPALRVDLDSLFLGATLTSWNATLVNGGGPGTISVGQPTTDADWLSASFDPAVGNVIGAGYDSIPLILTVARTGLDLGTYEAAVTVPSDAGSVELNVGMRVVRFSGTDSGSQYVLLIDTDTGETKHFAIAEPQGDGTYRFTIDNVEPGTYRVTSGSDANYDLFVCDVAESCGKYPTYGNPGTIEVDGQDVEGVDFDVAYHPELIQTKSLAGSSVGIERPSVRPQEIR